MNPKKPKIVAGEVKKSPSFEAEKKLLTKAISNGGITYDSNQAIENIRQTSRALKYDITSDASLIMTPNTIAEARLFNCKPDALRNIFKQTEDFPNSVWDKGGITTTSNIVANPITGEINADKIVETTTTAQHFIRQYYVNSTPASIVYTGSIYIKSAGKNTIVVNMANTSGVNSQTSTIDLITGNVISGIASITNIGDGWYRVSKTYTSTTIGVSLQIFFPGGSYSGDGVSGYYLYGAQVEEGSITTPYQTVTDGIIDFQVTRATTASSVLKDGTIGDTCYNLLQRSDELTNAYWTKDSTVTVTANSDFSPLNGEKISSLLTPNSNNSSTVNRVHTNNGTNIPNTTPLTYSVYLKQNGIEYCHLRIRIGTSSTNYGICVNMSNGVLTQGYYDGSALSNFPDKYSSKIVNGYIFITLTTPIVTASTQGLVVVALSNSEFNTICVNSLGKGVYIAHQQLSQGSILRDYLKTTNRLAVPSIDYGLGSDKPVLLIEPQRTNLLTQSENISNISWTKVQSTISIETILAPNGVLSTYKIIESTSNAAHFIQQAINLVSGNIYSVSVFVKAGERDVVSLSFGAGFSILPSIVFNITTGLITSTSAGVTSTNIKNIGDGWYRICMTTIISNFSGAVNIQIGMGTYLGNGIYGVYVWGAQCEIGSNTTSYIPTTTATVTRNNYTSFLDLWNNNLLNKDNFTLYFEGYLLGNVTTNVMIALNDTTAITARANDLAIFDGCRPSYAVSNTVTSDLVNMINNSSFKIIIVRNGSQVKWYRNGVLVYNQIIPIFNYRYLAVNNGGSTYSLNKLILWKHTKSDTDCILLTTKTNTTVSILPSFIPYLDTYTGAKFAYSLRKLRTSHSGSCLRVRRESDDVEQDIGFNTSGWIDAIALETFVGNSNGRVVTVYDQSGNGIDAFQDTPAWQPYIVRDGILVRINEFPAISFSNTSASIKIYLRIPIFNFTYCSLFSSFWLHTGDVNSRALSCSVTGGVDYVNNTSAITFGFQSFEAPNKNINMSLSTIKNITMTTRYHITNTQAFFTKNDISAIDSTITPGLFTPQQIQIGTEGDVGGPRFMVGYMFEEVFYDFDNSANDIAIKNNLELYKNQALS